MVKSSYVSNVFQVYLIWLNGTIEKCHSYWPPATYIMIKLLAGKRVARGRGNFCQTICSYSSRAAVELLPSRGLSNCSVLKALVFLLKSAKLLKSWNACKCFTGSGLPSMVLLLLCHWKVDMMKAKRHFILLGLVLLWYPYTLWTELWSCHHSCASNLQEQNKWISHSWAWGLRVCAHMCVDVHLVLIRNPSPIFTDFKENIFY